MAFYLIYHGRYGNKALKKMIGTMRKCSKDAFLDVPDNLYTDAIRSIDSYLVRARNSNGWHEGPIPFNYGVEPFDGMMHNILSRRRALVKNRVAAIEAAIKDGQTTLRL